MLTQARIAIISLALLTVVTGVAYPFAITAIVQVAFPHQANGSIVYAGEKGVGSELIGQPFDDPKYFWSRPSATGPVPYNAGASSGSNLGPTNPALLEAVRARVENLKKHDPDASSPVPVDLVTASGSGLDPHISPAAAEYQVKRVAETRKMSEETVRRLVAEHTEGRDFGLLGEPRVHVLLLNLALDAAGAPKGATQVDDE